MGKFQSGRLCRRLTTFICEALVHPERVVDPESSVRDQFPSSADYAYRDSETPPKLTTQELAELQAKADRMLTFPANRESLPRTTMPLPREPDETPTVVDHFGFDSSDLDQPLPDSWPLYVGVDTIPPTDTLTIENLPLEELIRATPNITRPLDVDTDALVSELVETGGLTADAATHPRSFDDRVFNFVEKHLPHGLVRLISRLGDER